LISPPPLANQVWPALTTVRKPITAMAAQAAELLLRQLKGEVLEASPHVIASQLTFRQSTGPAKNRRRAKSRSEQSVVET